MWHTKPDKPKLQKKTEAKEVEPATYSAAGWAKNNIIGAHIYFIFTGNDLGLSDQENERKNNGQ
ncbi:hypothetical protein LVD15_22960 [Fulvivirga maritima]|uniref:hypothetical protein n=1 Tax=Fulvivirga maritima TaxID=2904247 RepID=UPI001F3B38B9|nr:hypothetical protein [Fulvivirga maritima]UII26134.1 hypothetical protein LVD15_22960 [Fulvivirga maritima]